MRINYIDQEYEVTILLGDNCYDSKIIFAINVTTNRILEKKEIIDLELANLDEIRNYYYLMKYKPTLIKT